MTDKSGTPPADMLARALMIGGAILATTAVAVWGLGVFPVLPEWMVRLALFKLTLASAAGLLVAGAAIRRSAQRSRRAEPPQLGDGAVPPGPAQDDRVHARNEVR